MAGAECAWLSAVNTIGMRDGEIDSMTRLGMGETVRIVTVFAMPGRVGVVADSEETRAAAQLQAALLLSPGLSIGDSSEPRKRYGIISFLGKVTT